MRPYPIDLAEWPLREPPPHLWDEDLYDVDLGAAMLRAMEDGGSRGASGVLDAHTEHLVDEWIEHCAQMSVEEIDDMSGGNEYAVALRMAYQIHRILKAQKP